MNIRMINKIVAPVYIYIFLLIVYSIFIPYVASDVLSNIMFYTILIGLPIVFWMWLNLRLRRFKKGKISYNYALLISAIPGFFPGAIFGFGVWGMGHGDTVIGFLSYILSFGIPTALIFGVLGSMLQFILDTFKK